MTAQRVKREIGSDRHTTSLDFGARVLAWVLAGLTDVFETDSGL